ncbi:MAG TPA: nucleotidyltransferase domain-containing protein [Fimbriimonadaceae bacterium]|nr:nucleotidyltransferase domain-containing protein [Fimbriimonadaceae bacterium]
MSALQLLELHRREIEALCARFCVKSMRLFGSAVTDSWDASKSDFDFVVEYAAESERLDPLDRLVGLQLGLESVLGRKVDVVDWGAARNELFKDIVRDTSEMFYAA